MISAAAVPRWSRVSNGANAGSVSRKWSPTSGGTTTAWPSDDTGKSSVSPCRAARKKMTPALSTDGAYQQAGRALTRPGPESPRPGNSSGGDGGRPAAGTRLEQAGDVARRDDADEMVRVEDHGATVRGVPDSLEQVGETLLPARDRHRGRWDGDVDRATVATLLGREAFDGPHRDQTVHPAVDAVGGEGREVMAHHVLVDEQLDGDPRGDDHRVLRHHVPDENALECVASLLAVGLAARRSIEEPADEHQPEAADRIEKEQADDPQADQGNGEDATAPRCDHRRCQAVVGSGPDEAAQDSPAVERERGNEIEDEKQDVEGGQVLGDEDDDVRRPDGRKDPGDPRRDRRHHEGDRRPDRGDEHLGPAGHPVAAHLRHTAEQPEPDALDSDAAPASQHRVAQLVGGE